MNVGKYTLVNVDKVERAIHGTVGAGGSPKGGVGDDAKPADILAEYDRLGGHILMDGKYKVKMGSFYDFKGKKPHDKPAPILVFNVNGETVEVPANKPLPLEVQAAEAAAVKKAGKRKAKADADAASKKSKNSKAAKKAKDSEDEEGEEEEESEEEETEGEAA